MPKQTIAQKETAVPKSDGLTFKDSPTGFLMATTCLAGGKTTLPTTTKSAWQEFLIVLGAMFLYFAKLCYSIAEEPLNCDLIQETTNRCLDMFREMDKQIVMKFEKAKADIVHQAKTIARRKVRKNQLAISTDNPGVDEVLDMTKKYHKNSDPETVARQCGSAYGYSWTAIDGGVQLVGKVMIAAHLYSTKTHDVLLHGFPDLISKIVPERLSVGDTIEYWDEGLRTAKVVGNVLSSGRHGNRTLYGVVPAFLGPTNLVSGTPIFKDGKLVSVVTTSNGSGLYAISGIGGNSGHMLTHRVRLRKAGEGKAAYGKTIADYDIIKNEAVRIKGNKTGPLNVELVLFPNRLDVIGWRGDNFEEFHFRQAVSCTDISV